MMRKLAFMLAIDLSAGCELLSGSWGHAGIFTNFRWADIRHTRGVESPVGFSATLRVIDRDTGEIIGEEANVFPFGFAPPFGLRNVSDFWGVGFGFGLEAEFALSCDFRVGGKLGLTGLVGEQSFHRSGIIFNSNSGTTDTNVTVPNRTCFVPAIDVPSGTWFFWPNIAKPSPRSFTTGHA